MIRKLLSAAMAALGLSLLLAGESMAAQATYEVGYSSFGVRGVYCTTGTVVDITATLPTGLHARIAGYRIQNHDTADDVYVGGASVSTNTASADAIAELGEKLVPGASIVYHLGLDFAIPGIPRKRVYCRAVDAGGAVAPVVSVAFFGY